MNKIIKKILLEGYSLTDKIESLVMSGGKKNFTFTNEELSVLKQTVKNTNYTLYRGIGLIRDRVDRKNFEAINNLQIGDKLPNFLKKGYFSNDYVSYTKKKSVSYSRQYAEGQVSIVFMVETGPENILCDLENIPELNLPFEDEQDFDYFRKEKEVFVTEANITPTIIFKHGKF